MNRIDTQFLRDARLRAQTVREVVFDFLRRQGMTRIFGNPGSTEVPMFADLPDDFSYVLGLQEASVVGMADGYAQITGNAQFINLHSAAGLGHALGSIYTAYRDRAPLVIVTGQQTRALLPHDPFLFNESPAEFPKPYVKWACEPARAADVPAAIAKAYYIAMQPPRGPVLVSVPIDDWDQPAAPLPEREITSSYGAAPEALDRLAAKLNAAREPTIVVGPEVDSDGAWDATVRLAERLQAKVWASPKSPRAGFPESHPLFAGFLPAVQPGLTQCLGEADFVLVLGAPVFTYHFPSTDEHIPDGAELCLVTDDPKQVAGAAVGSAIVSNMKLAAEGLAARVKQRSIRTEPARPKPARVSQSLGISNEYFYQTLGELRSPDSILVEEAPSSHEALHDHFPWCGRTGSLPPPAAARLRPGGRRRRGARQHCEPRHLRRARRIVPLLHPVGVVGGRVRRGHPGHRAQQRRLPRTGGDRVPEPGAQDRRRQHRPHRLRQDRRRPGHARGALRPWRRAGRRIEDHAGREGRPPARGSDHGQGKRDEHDVEDRARPQGAGKVLHRRQVGRAHVEPAPGGDLSRHRGAHPELPRGGPGRHGPRRGGGARGLR
jgi:thiamine pyrophosphate-dependent acetolactate synthase large subunit-like protein